MEKVKTARIIKPKDREQWYMQHIGAFALGLDKLQDAATIKKERLRTAPLTMLDMVF